jgi:hypothetical protein
MTPAWLQRRAFGIGCYSDRLAPPGTYFALGVHVLDCSKWPAIPSGFIVGHRYSAITGHNDFYSHWVIFLTNCSLNRRELAFLHPAK